MPTKHKSKINSNTPFVKISLAGPEMIRKWSYGEVLKPETLNYKTLNPEKDGLFDQRIFGPIKDYECACGRYKKIKNKGRQCEVCKVDVVKTSERRYRMGHITLEEPVVHIWMFKTSPAWLSLILGLTNKVIKEIIYYLSYVVVEVRNSRFLTQYTLINQQEFQKNTLLVRDVLKEIQEIVKSLPKTAKYARAEGQDIISDLESNTYQFTLTEIFDYLYQHTGVVIATGAIAIEKMLKNLHFPTEIKKVKKALSQVKNVATRAQLLKRERTLQLFDKNESENKPEWMILKILPVIPPDLRPILQLDGGRFTSSEINDLYRRVLIRNNRLRRMKQEHAPEVMINNERFMLQEAVDALFYNEVRTRPILNKLRNPLKSLTSVLKGKSGRFRQNLLGKRVDYSGRSVIVVGPDLKMNQCGINREMALIMFKPFVLREILKSQLTNNVLLANAMVKDRDPRLWPLLSKVVKERPVILNRAPTLHRLGIQGFEVVLTQGKVIQLHPMVTTAFNADFDGDQMAVHIPLSDPAVAEVRTLISSLNSILNPKDGRPIVGPTQDMVLGIYYLTLENATAAGSGTVFSTVTEAITAYETGHVALHAVVGIDTNALPQKMLPSNHVLVTTIGKIIFNEVFVDPFLFLNCKMTDDEQVVGVYEWDQVPDCFKQRTPLAPLTKREFRTIIGRYFHLHGARRTARMLDLLKAVGFKYSDKSGISISLSDIQAQTNKIEIIKEADEQAKSIHQYFQSGWLTADDKTNQIYQLWSKAKSKIQKQLTDYMVNHPYNPMFMMADSGARGNISNFTQLMGMRGLMTNPQGHIIEIPVKSSFRQGLSMTEYFISTHGARKGFVDIAIKTADAGYLTRRLVDAAQELVIRELDCGTVYGFGFTAILETNFHAVIIPLENRIIGRHLLTNLVVGATTVPAGTLITPAIAQKIVGAKIERVLVRSVLTCQAKNGVCIQCYGVNLTHGRLCKIGDVVGVLAAQSIGEPGTQLTMRNFHTGGVADEADITQGLPRIKELLDVTLPKGGRAFPVHTSGTITGIERQKAKIKLTITTPGGQKTSYLFPNNTVLKVRVGQKVRTGEFLSEGAANIKDLLKMTSADYVAQYILSEAQRVYNFQGIEINDKHFELIIAQMLCRVQICDAGDADVVEGAIITRIEYQRLVHLMAQAQKKPPWAQPLIYGIKRVPILNSSFLAAASFQETTRVLSEAVCESRTDYLRGLKENIILGRVIPAGTGLKTDDEIIEQGLQAEVD